MAELRIPRQLIYRALAQKKIKQLRLLVAAKMHGHRVVISDLLAILNIKERTGKRLIDWLVANGFARTDGVHLFLKSWQKVELKKRGGLYLTEIPTDLKFFEALCFAKALKKRYRRVSQVACIKDKALQIAFPSKYLSTMLRISTRRFERLKSLAQKYRFLSSLRQYSIIGKSSQLKSLRKNLPGLPIFLRGKYCVVPEISTIQIWI